MKTNWILPAIGIAFILLFLFGAYKQYSGCTSRGGVLVSSVGGWECVEPR